MCVQGVVWGCGGAPRVQVGVLQELLLLLQPIAFEVPAPWDVVSFTLKINSGSPLALLLASDSTSGYQTLFLILQEAVVYDGDL